MDNQRKRRKLTKLCVRQRWRCYWCNCRIFMNQSGVVKQENDTATLDHYIPRSAGGSNDIENCVAACYTCNRTKADRMPTTFWGLTS
jgi:5-methylcytosine-specific restriction endonuclease McrA